MNKITDYFSRLPKLYTLLLGTVLIALITVIDYFTHDYFVLPFYIIPVGIVTLLAGRIMGIIAAFLAASVALVADVIETPFHVDYSVHYWNGFIIFSLLIVVVLVLQKLVDTMHDLKQSEENYHSIFELANDAIIVRDIKTYRVVDVNAKACQMFGYSKDEMIGLELRYLIPDSGDYSYKNFKPLYDTAARGAPQLFEWVVKDKMEREFWVEVSVKRAIIGRQYRIISIARDISDRKVC